MDKEDLLRELRIQLLDSRMNQRYHTFREDSLAKVDRGARVLAALTGSAAIATSALWDTPQGKQAWMALTAVAAVVSTFAAVFAPAEHARKHTALRQRWIALRYSLDSLRLDVERETRWPNARIQDRYVELLRERGSIERDEPPAIRRILLRAQDQIKQEIGAGAGLAR